MRVVIFTCALMVAGCAGQPETPAVPATTVVAKASQKAPTATPLGADGKINKEALANAKQLGYTPIDKDGNVLYCRTDLKTGSRVERETVCLTAAEIEDLREKTKQNMSDFARQIRPPVSH